MLRKVLLLSQDTECFFPLTRKKNHVADYLKLSHKKYMKHYVRPEYASIFYSPPLHPLFSFPNYFSLVLIFNLKTFNLYFIMSISMYFLCHVSNHLWKELILINNWPRVASQPSKKSNIKPDLNVSLPHRPWVQTATPWTRKFYVDEDWALECTINTGSP